MVKLRKAWAKQYHLFQGDGFFNGGRNRVENYYVKFPLAKKKEQNQDACLTLLRHLYKSPSPMDTISFQIWVCFYIAFWIFLSEVMKRDVGFKKKHVTNINLKKIPKWYEDINVKPFSFSFNTALFLGTSSQRSSWLEISISVDSTNASVDLPMTWNLYEQLASSSQKMQIIMWKKKHSFAQWCIFWPHCATKTFVCHVFFLAFWSKQKRSTEQQPLPVEQAAASISPSRPRER